LTERTGSGASFLALQALNSISEDMAQTSHKEGPLLKLFGVMAGLSWRRS
jgi:hypothetical protein